MVFRSCNYLSIELWGKMFILHIAVALVFYLKIRTPVRRSVFSEVYHFFTLLFYHFLPSLFVNLDGQRQLFTDLGIFWCRQSGRHISVIRSFLEFLVQIIRSTTSRVPRCSTKATRHSPHQKKNEIIIFKKNSLKSLTIYFICTCTDTFLFHFKTCVEGKIF